MGLADAYLLPQSQANVGKKHQLDIGSGTGYYLRRGGLPAATQLTLVGLERPALEIGLHRSGRAGDARGIVADILQPFLVEDDTKFDSISVYYLLHCISANVKAKCGIFAHIKHNITPE